MRHLPTEFLRQIKIRLGAEKKRLEKEEKELAKEDPFLAPGRDVGNPEFAEEAEEGIGHERVAAQRGIIQKLLVDTRLALSKFRIGRYGICEKCGNRIDRARLEALPQARYCLDCVKKSEQKK